MRNIFDTISQTLGQVTNSVNPWDRQNSNNSNANAANNAANSNSRGSNFGQIGAMGVGGLLGALVSNPKNMTRTIKQAAMIGGGAALGGLAYSMYQKWRNNSNQQGYSAPSPSPYSSNPYSNPASNGGFSGQGGFGQVGQNQGGVFAPVNTGGFGAATANRGAGQIGYTSAAGTAFPQAQQPVGAGQNPFAAYNAQNQPSAQPEVNSDAISDLLLEAMVFAARADNHIDANEQQMIMKIAQELKPSQDLLSKISEFLNEPLDPNTLARKMPNPEMAPDLYRLSAAAIVADTPIERQYLKSLAQALHLSDAQVRILDQEALQFRAQAAQ